MARDLMTCSEFALRLEAGLDDEGLRHLSGCARCRLRRDAFEAEEAVLRRALRPVPAQDVPAGLEARLLSALPRGTRRGRARIAFVGAAAAAALLVAYLSLRDVAPSVTPSPVATSVAAAAEPIRFDADTRRLSLADGSEMRLSPGSDAEFEPVPGTRGRLRLRQGDIFALATPGDEPLLLEAPGLRARTSDARFLATTRAADSSDGAEPSSAVAAARVYVLAGDVAVEEGAAPVFAAQNRPSCPRDAQPALSCRACHDAPGRLAAEFSGLLLPESRRTAPASAIPEGSDAGTPAGAAGAVSGRVLDVHGNVVAGAFVRLRRAGSGTLSVKTDEAGRFSLGDVEPGACEVAATAPLYLDGSVTAEIAAGESLDLGVIALREERRLSGRVVDRNGAPVAGARVHARPEGAEPAVADPRTTILGSIPAFGHLVEPDGDPQKAIEMTRLRLGAADKLLLDIRSMAPTDPLGGAIPDAVALRAERFDVEVQTQFRLGWSKDSTLVVADLRGGRGTETGEDGTFEIPGLGDGTYTLTAAYPGWIGFGEPVTAAGGESGLEIVLTPGGEVRGTVYGPDGAPLAGARVNDSVTDEDGKYRIAGLKGGAVDLFAGPGGPNRIVFVRYESRGSAPVPELSSLQLDAATRHGIVIGKNGRITVTPDSTPDGERPGIAVRRDVIVTEGAVLDGVDFHLPSARVIDGFVVDDDGVPVAGAAVEFRPSADILYFPSARHAVSNDAGYFRMESVYDVPGAVVAAAAGHFESEPIDAGPDAFVAGLRAVVARAAGIRGEVAAPATLTLSFLGGGGGEEAVSHRIEPRSAESGEFRIESLRPGRYAVRGASDAGATADLGVIVLEPGGTADLGDLSPALGLR